jgi:hypothetical protein
LKCTGEETTQLVKEANLMALRIQCKERIVIM